MKYIELKSKILNDRYTEYVYDSFDIQNREETSVSIPLNLGDAKNFDWNIGVILGGSGTGKTTILKRLGDVKKVLFDSEKALISNFDWLEPKEASLVLTSMGLSSVPTWLRPFHTLSNGEQYRATLAYLVASSKDGEVILLDEYTSVVDRDVAKAMSFALQKYIRRENKKIILASCHYDILEWLMPDWTYSPQKGGALERCDYRRHGKPKIELSISRVESETWNFFKKHHYLTEDVNKSCKFLLFEWNEKPVGIVAIINQPGKDRANAFAISRIVVLPDFQGMGLGVKLSEFAGGIVKGQGGRCFIKTVNPALGKYFNNKTSIWKGTTSNGKSRTIKDNTDKSAKNRLTRWSYSHEYIGDSIDGYNELLLPINEMRKK
jgi:energy-coupling factor transporter ATP-binding protein EcfA2/GNAT superfamily N-acetyltransferase